ncbi:MAG: DUF1501 domain-containing protein [Gemmataceae bacterium]|nr:DUF1501 domain-containing protein [Gemmataceae bacterium]
MCDGVSRRGFLHIGALGVGAGALTLADLFRLEARGAAKPSRHKSVIFVCLGGGPPHQDMFEIKTEAPENIRGPFKPIATNVTGVRIGECLPRIAARMDKCAVIRSVVGMPDRHDMVMPLSGWKHDSLSSMGGRPSIGAVLSKVAGPVDPSVPPFVGLAARTTHVPWSDAGTPGFLGIAHAPFKPDANGLGNLKLKGTSVEALGDRKRLLASFDGLRKELDTSGSLKALDGMTEKALGVLTGSKLVEALDLSKESVQLRERYGDGKPYKFQYDGAPTVNEQFLMARRLVEAGVRCVTLSYGRWDSHGKNFDLVRDHGPKLDQAFSALIDDLETRGMLDDVTVVAMGEMGRTPTINKDAGRDHWPQVAACLMAGGGMKTGKAIGSTNRLGQHANNRPVHCGEIMATIYHNLGIDCTRTAILDPTGRPQHLVAHEPMRELV